MIYIYVLVTVKSILCSECLGMGMGGVCFYPSFAESGSVVMAADSPMAGASSSPEYSCHTFAVCAPAVLCHLEFGLWLA